MWKLYLNVWEHEAGVVPELQLKFFTESGKFVLRVGIPDGGLLVSKVAGMVTQRLMIVRC